MSVSDRWVSYEPHDWPNFYVCVTVGCSDMSKFTDIYRRFRASATQATRK